MIAAASDSLTLGGFVALSGLAISAIGMALNTSSKNNDLRERIVKLETMLEAHLKNGDRHERR
jgi:hypothetical protein